MIKLIIMLIIINIVKNLQVMIINILKKIDKNQKNKNYILTKKTNMIILINYIRVMNSNL